MYKFSSTLRFSLAFCMGLFMASSFLVSSVPKEKQTPIAGVAIFPNEEYGNWLRMQLNSAFGNREKIISTINEFFILKYESWLKETLLDFGFLFDQDDAEALEDYAYERGLLYLSLEGWRYNNTLLESYQYEPNFYKVLIGKSKATVKMRPNANLVHRHTQGRISSSPWTEHKISLILKGDRWLIKRIVCDDPVHNIYPHGSDFEKLAATLHDRNRDELAKDEARIAEDPGAIGRIFKNSKDAISLGWRRFYAYKCKWYALEYSSNDPGTSSYNPLFSNYDEDCQNFVSQCLWYGFGGINQQDPIENHDLPMIDDDIEAITWWCDSSGTGQWEDYDRYCWTGVSDFLFMIQTNYSYHYVGLAGYRGLSMAYLMIGDVIKPISASHVMVINNIVDYDGDGNADFNEIYICAHTNNRRNVLLSDLFSSPTLLRFYYISGFKNPD